MSHETKMSVTFLKYRWEWRHNYIVYVYYNCFITFRDVTVFLVHVTWLKTLFPWHSWKSCFRDMTAKVVSVTWLKQCFQTWNRFLHYRNKTCFLCFCNIAFRPHYMLPLIFGLFFCFGLFCFVWVAKKERKNRFIPTFAIQAIDLAYAHVGLPETTKTEWIM